MRREPFLFQTNSDQDLLVKKRDANHEEKGNHSGARFDLCTAYGDAGSYHFI